MNNRLLTKVKRQLSGKDSFQQRLLEKLDICMQKGVDSYISALHKNEFKMDQWSSANSKAITLLKDNIGENLCDMR